MKPLFTLYLRSGCHLCEAFVDELESQREFQRFDYEKVDIDDNAQLAKAYGTRVPLLCLNGEVVCEHFFDPDKLSGHVN